MKEAPPKQPATIPPQKKLQARKHKQKRKKKHKHQPPHHYPAQGVPFDLVQVDLSAKPGWFRAVNARGLVPAVQWRGRTVVESVDIVRWVSKWTAHFSVLFGGGGGDCL